MNLQMLSQNRFTKMKSSKFALASALILMLAVVSGCLNDDNLIPENCYDGILNNGEELIDCGGSICPACDPCENGQYDALLGETWVDCGGECGPCDPSFNGVQDPGEAGIDCGGDTGVACGELCGDGLLNGNEQAVDCGGPDCEPCPTCCDGLMNGDELAVDCGGNYESNIYIACENPNIVCGPCPDGVNCGNGLMDGDELYIDCGGDYCPECESILTWKANGTALLAETELSAELDGTTITVTGLTLTGAGLALVMEVPLAGWVAGSQIQCSAATGSSCSYADPAANAYSTNFGGGVTVDIAYVDAVSGGFVVGTFMGTVVGLSGESMNIAQGAFQMQLD